MGRDELGALPTLEQAWRRALYGAGGFYRREPPAHHFRTAAHAAADLLAEPLLRLASLGGCRTIVDVGAGSGELMAAVAAHPMAGGLDLVAVELRPRPAGLPQRVRWLDDVPHLPGASLLIGWELLDVVPCPVLRADDGGTLRELVVRTDGQVVPGAGAQTADRAWAGRWWPGPWEAGQVVEVGRTREELWARLTGRQEEGLSLAVDYDHPVTARPVHGSLLGYRDGAVRVPEFDGGMDLTAHVALDAVGDRLGLPHLLLRQAAALRALGLETPNPPHSQAACDPVGYVRALDRAGRSRELLDPAGLGGFGWLVGARGRAARDALARLRRGVRGR